MRVNSVCKNCALEIRGYEFLATLMLLPFDEFDVTLGMDWLTNHDAVVKCKQKQIVLKHLSDKFFSVEANRSDCFSKLISIFSTRKLICKGAKAYLACILDTQASE